MACSSHCLATAAHFDRRTADQDREAYHRRGPGPTTRMVIDQLSTVPLAGRSLVDVGGGIGVIGLELLGSGIRQVTLVEAAPAYLAVAAEEFASRGAGDRLETRPGDFVELDPPPAADVVTLDRVVCCYPDYRRLLEQAALSSGRLLALSYPRDRWYVRLGVGVENLFRRIKGDAFRAFVHSAAGIEEVLRQAGFRRTTRGETVFWCVELWVRG